jgi:hypothetical protein
MPKKVNTASNHGRAISLEANGTPRVIRRSKNAVTVPADVQLIDRPHKLVDNPPRRRKTNAARGYHITRLQTTLRFGQGLTTAWDMV